MVSRKQHCLGLNLLIFIAMPLCTPYFAQGRLLPLGTVGAVFNGYRYGRSASLFYRQELPHHFSLIAGVKYHINDRTSYATQFPNPDEPIEPEAFIMRYYALNSGQRLGFKFGIEHTLPLKLRNTELFLYYDFQWTKLNLQTISYTYSHTDTFPGGHIVKYVEKVYTNEGPFNCTEHHVGVGARFALSTNCFIKMQGGAGYFIPSFRGNDRHSFQPFSYMYGIGIEVKVGQAFGKKK